MNEKNALVGHTGFIGSFLKSAGEYPYLYNSSNIEEIRGGRFDTIVCAGAPAAKWRANAEPEQDQQNIRRLTDSLAQAHAKQFFLISTIDVFRDPVKVDENSPVEIADLHAYGANRYELENFVRDRFPHSCVIRLPALFGPGLRKNALYDLLHDNCLEQLPLDGVFQWYSLKRLPDDMRRAAAFPLAHMATEPVSMRMLIERLFPEKTDIGQTGKGACYDMRTIHAESFGGAGHYIAGANAVLAGMEAFVREERSRRTAA